MNNRRITRTSVDRTGNQYCGPLVLAALFGCSTAEAAAKVTFAERYQQARLYAAQVRVRRAMGDKYAHATPWRGSSIQRQLQQENLHCVNRKPTTPGVSISPALRPSTPSTAPEAAASLHILGHSPALSAG